jgi:membrane-bound lytic murein transglycosylase D
MRKIYYVASILLLGGLIQGCATSNSAVNDRTGLAITGQTTASAPAGTQCTPLTGTSVPAGSSVTTTADQDISDVLAQSTAPENLEKITTDTDIPMVMNEKVQYFINYFSDTQHDIFAKWLERSEQYIPQMKKILRENGLPEDLVYMALIESGFNTHAISRSSACGPWQFMRGTARLYHLKVNW